MLDRLLFEVTQVYEPLILGLFLFALWLTNKWADDETSAQLLWPSIFTGVGLATYPMVPVSVVTESAYLTYCASTRAIVITLISAASGFIYFVVMSGFASTVLSLVMVGLSCFYALSFHFLARVSAGYDSADPHLMAALGLDAPSHKRPSAGQRIWDLLRDA
ncbi:unnamed protein product, partial [Mesorhabditis spiculigera]